MKKDIRRPRYIAHRGVPGHRENTVAGFLAAYQSSIEWVECDVHLSRDEQPMLVHDWFLPGARAAVGDMTARELMEVFSLDSLRDLSRLLGDNEGRRALVELKEESLERHSAHVCVGAVLANLPIGSRQTAIISFNVDALKVARQMCELPVGLVLRDLEPESMKALRDLNPAIALVALDKARTCVRLPRGWVWIVYGVETVEDYLVATRLGADFVQSKRAPQLREEVGPPPEAPVLRVVGGGGR